MNQLTFSRSHKAIKQSVAVFHCQSDYMKSISFGFRITLFQIQRESKWNQIFKLRLYTNVFVINTLADNTMILCCAKYLSTIKLIISSKRASEHLFLQEHSPPDSWLV